MAAPLRRSGAFTLPDFCELRLRSRRLRKLAAAFVVFIGWLYLVPQLQGAGLTLQTVTGGPYALGALLVAAVVTGNVALGGMRAITFVQAFQYWLKLTALAVPVMFLLLHWQADGRPGVVAARGRRLHRGHRRSTFEHRPRLTLTEPTRVAADGEVDGRARSDGTVDLSAGPARVRRRHGGHLPGRRGGAGGRRGRATGRGWLLPGGAGTDGLFATYSLILATFLGTMGLPHVLVRFYTNPDGAAARRTTLVVLGLVGMFYLFPTLYGVLGRVYAPQLLLTGETDAVVLVLPGARPRRRPGRPAAGRAGRGRRVRRVPVQRLRAAHLGRRRALDRRHRQGLGARLPDRGRRRRASCRSRWRCAWPSLDVSLVVGLAFAVAASSFCPLLVLGIWWRGLTDLGAAAGILAGGGGGGAAPCCSPSSGRPGTGWTATLLTYPAAWTVPLAFAVMIGVSLATRRRVPGNVALTMLRLHAPDAAAPVARRRDRSDAVPLDRSAPARSAQRTVPAAVADLHRWPWPSYRAPNRAVACASRRSPSIPSPEQVVTHMSTQVDPRHRPDPPVYVAVQAVPRVRRTAQDAARLHLPDDRGVLPLVRPLRHPLGLRP